MIFIFKAPQKSIKTIFTKLYSSPSLSRLSHFLQQCELSRVNISSIIIVCRGWGLMGKHFSKKSKSGYWSSFATNMCMVVCFNSQWRSVVIGTVSCISSLFILFLTIGYQQTIVDHIESHAARMGCYEYRQYDKYISKQNRVLVI